MTKNSNMNTIDEAIEILQAMKEGKEIEFDCDGQWVSSRKVKIGDFPFFDGFKYRVKPEPRKPREVIANIYPNGSMFLWAQFNSPVEIEKEMRTVLFREVIEEE